MILGSLVKDLPLGFHLVQHHFLSFLELVPLFHGKSSSLTSTSSALASLASYLFLLSSSTAAPFSLASCLSFRVYFTYLSSSLISFIRLAILLSTSVFSEDSAGGAARPSSRFSCSPPPSPARARRGPRGRSLAWPGAPSRC